MVIARKENDPFPPKDQLPEYPQGLYPAQSIDVLKDSSERNLNEFMVVEAAKKFDHRPCFSFARPIVQSNRLRFLR